MSSPTHLLSDSLLSFFSSVTHHSLHLFPVLLCSPSPHSCALNPPPPFFPPPIPLSNSSSVPLASLSSLLITPFPSPGSSLTSSCASSYQRRWLRSQTTSLENGVFPRWWDSYVQTHFISKMLSHNETCRYYLDVWWRTTIEREVLSMHTWMR